MTACSVDAADAPLPTPEARPEADVVLYDGKCGICTAQVRKLPWWDCQRHLAYLSLHDPEVARRWPDLPIERLYDEMCIVEHATGRRYWGAYAIRYLTRRLRRLWWAAPAFYLPGAMLAWKPLYRWIARNRYRLSGMTCDGGTCHLHAGPKPQ